MNWTKQDKKTFSIISFILLIAILVASGGFLSIITASQYYEVGDSVKVTYSGMLTSSCVGLSTTEIKIYPESGTVSYQPVKQFYVKSYSERTAFQTVNSIQYWSIPLDNSYADTYRVTGRVFCDATNQYISNEDYYSFRVDEISISPPTPTCTNDCVTGSTRYVTIATCTQQVCGQYDTDSCSEWSGFESIPGCIIPQDDNCYSNWITGDWGTCINGQEMRQVYDDNNCAVSTGTRPISVQECDNNDVQPVSWFDTNLNYIILGAGGMIALFLISMILMIPKK